MVEEEIIVGSSRIYQENIRPLIVQTACNYESKIEIVAENITVNAKSIMGIMATPIDRGNKIIIRASGNDEVGALAGMREFFE